MRTAAVRGRPHYIAVRGLRPVRTPAGGNGFPTRPEDGLSMMALQQGSRSIAVGANGADGRRSIRGFTLLELMVAIAVGAVVIALAASTYTAYAKRARNAAAIADIGKIQLAIDRYALNHGGELPPNLAAIGKDGLRDPWGNAYVYLSFAGLKGKGAMRKDKNLVPINTEYDLYSMGPDGQSRAPLTAKASRDDIVRANDGGYIGVAADY
jgi:general secretion pathway protein G